MAANEHEPATNPEPETNTAPSPLAQQFENDTAPASQGGKTLPSALDLFDMSRKAVWVNLVPFVWIALVPGIIGAISTVSGNGDWLRDYTHTPHHVSSGAISLWLVVGLYTLLTIAARPWLQLASVKGRAATFGEAFGKGIHFFWRMLGLEVLTGLIVLVGLLLLIVPGIIFIRRYFLAPYFMLDQDLGIMESLRRSSAATKGHSGAVWGVIGVAVLLGLTNVIPAAGPFIAAVLAWLYSCAPALRYEQLKG